jgi:penicillin-binding protein-related factor A (putative recombinase)
MKSKEFEDICLYRMRQHEERGEATMSRYGVQASYRDDKWQPLQSLPDFEGLLPGGRQFIFDCKVSGQASFALDEDKFKRRQLRHMLTRSRFGGICFLLIHFTDRFLKRSHEPAVTWAFPVFTDHPLWLACDRGETKRITREDCGEYAVLVQWNCLPGGKKPRPDILQAIKTLVSAHCCA